MRRCGECDVQPDEDLFCFFFLFCSTLLIVAEYQRSTMLRATCYTRGYLS